MAAQLGLPDALRRRGLTVETVAGWETRSAGSFNPKGAVCHWTAGPANATGRPSLNVVVNGRPGLSGPLCNVYLDRAGIAVVVSANRANHAGVGNWKSLTGNSAVFGTEAEGASSGDFTAAQRWAYPRVNAAYSDLGGFGADMVCGHSEWATPAGRKTDINGYTMTEMRAQVAALRAGGDENDVTPDQWAYIVSMNSKLDRATDASEGVWRMLKGAHGDNADRLTDLWTAILAIKDPNQTSDPSAVAAALAGMLPKDIAKQVADELVTRLAS